MYETGVYEIPACAFLLWRAGEWYEYTNIRNTNALHQNVPAVDIGNEIYGLFFGFRISDFGFYSFT